MNQNYQELANAIIVQASHDYIKYFKVLKILKLVNTSRLNDIQKRKLEKKIDAAKANLDEVRSFFCSEWSKQLTNLDPKSILNKLELEAEA
ncbi:MAG: hypothetical protein ACI4DY_15280 [Monoglobaceae bacterium]